MASPLTESSPPPPTLLRDVIGNDDDDDDDGNFVAEEEEEDEEEEWDMSKRMSRLSMEGSDGGDADDEDDGRAGGEEDDEEEDDDEFEVRSDINGATPYDASDARRGRQWPPAPSSASLPGTPERGVGGGGGSKGYASETEARWPPEGGRGGRRPPPHHRRRERMAREVWLERAWRLRKQRRQMQEAAVPVVVLGGGGGESPAAGGGGVAMDMEEVRACRDLGLDLPCDWTVEIPAYHALSGVDTASSGGNSPASGSWRISSPGDDPNDVKARLKVWAQAVALASASRLGS
ncbi:unnamed protein product [Urochloa humidicola]